MQVVKSEIEELLQKILRKRGIIGVGIGTSKELKKGMKWKASASGPGFNVHTTYADSPEGALRSLEDRINKSRKG
jgi:hypothetical protein